MTGHRRRFGVSSGDISWHGTCCCALRVLLRGCGMVGSINTVFDDKGAMLSPREREVALLVARGLSNKEVARELGLCEGTVKLHVHSIFRKLGTKSRYGLIAQGSSVGFDA